MLLVAGPMPEVLRFLQILSWIILPILCLSIILTVFLHKRKRKYEKTPVETALDNSTAERIAYKNEDGQLVYFDHSPLIREYKKRLSTAKAKYSAVQRDLTQLSEKYVATARYARILFLTHKTDNMENANGQLSAQLHEEIEKIAKETVAEKQALQHKIDHLEQSLNRLATTNKSLSEQLKLSNATEDEKISALHRSNEEVADLKEKLMNLEYLEEVLEEKKSQINFLQDQLENRVRSSHQTEQQRASIASELDRLRSENISYLNKIDSLNTQLETTNENGARFEALSINQKAEIEEKDQLLSAGSGEVSYLKSQIAELRNQYEMTAAALADCTDRESRLQDLLTLEQSRAAHLHHKLQTANTLLRRIQKEISYAVPDDEHSSPVIPLHPEMNMVQNGETAEAPAPALV